MRSYCSIGHGTLDIDWGKLPVREDLCPKLTVNVPLIFFKVRYRIMSSIIIIVVLVIEEISVTRAS